MNLDTLQRRSNYDLLKEKKDMTEKKRKKEGELIGFKNIASAVQTTDSVARNF